MTQGTWALRTLQEKINSSSCNLKSQRKHLFECIYSFANLQVFLSDIISIHLHKSELALKIAVTVNCSYN